MRLFVARAIRVAAILLFLGTGGAAAQRSLELRRFHAQLVVQPNGDLLVTETITAHFTGSWNGLVRRIPVEYRTERGLNYTLRMHGFEAHDTAGAVLRIESNRSGNERVFRIYVPGAENATRTISFRYRVENGLRFFDDYDELYWNVTGDESDVPVQQAVAEVFLPPAAANVRTRVYTGVYGSTESAATTDITANRVLFETTRPLGYREGMTVAVAWDPGVVDRPSEFEKATWILLANSILLVPVLAGFGMFGLWRRFGRDPEARPITPQYEPPADLSPAEAGTIVDDRADIRDVTATVVDLAVRGFIRVEEAREEHLFGLFSSRDYAFHRVRPQQDWAGLKPHERALLRALFGGRDEVRASDLENSFYKDLPDITKALDDILVSGGYYPRHPNTVRVVFIVAAFTLGFGVAIVGSGVLTVLLGQSPGSAVVAGVVTGVIIGGFGLVMPRRTVRGARTVEHLRGFEEFLQRVEADRFDRVIRTPEMFERFLPFAMAFGVEKNWARAFEDICREPPSWYTGGDPHSFSSYAFTNRLSRMSSATGSAMQSAPRSSSGSSSFGGGGGFSGGGFGGGGTGGF